MLVLVTFICYQDIVIDCFLHADPDLENEVCNLENEVRENNN